MFLLTRQNIPVSLPFIVIEKWLRQNTNSKSFFFGQNFNNFWQNWILIFLLHSFSRHVSCGYVFIFFARKVLGDMARTRKALQTDGRGTDGRTYTEGRTIYVSRSGKHIMINRILTIIDRCVFSCLQNSWKICPWSNSKWSYETKLSIMFNQGLDLAFQQNHVCSLWPISLNVT